MNASTPPFCATPRSVPRCERSKSASWLRWGWRTPRRPRLAPCRSRHPSRGLRALREGRGLHPCMRPPRSRSRIQTRRWHRQVMPPFQSHSPRPGAERGGGLFLEWVPWFSSSAPLECGGCRYLAHPERAAKKRALRPRRRPSRLPPTWNQSQAPILGRRRARLSLRRNRTQRRGHLLSKQTTRMSRKREQTRSRFTLSKSLSQPPNQPPNQARMARSTRLPSFQSRTRSRLPPLKRSKRGRHRDAPGEDADTIGRLPKSGARHPLPLDAQRPLRPVMP